MRRTQKFCEITTLDLSYVVTVKSTVEISPTFVAFSEYMNFTALQFLTGSVQGQEKPVFSSWDPCNENRIFPVGNTTQGKPCFHYRDGFAVRVGINFLI